MHRRSLSRSRIGLAMRQRILSLPSLKIQPYDVLNQTTGIIGHAELVIILPNGNVFHLHTYFQALSLLNMYKQHTIIL